MSLLASHEEAKRALVGGLRALADVAGAAGMKTLRADLVDARIPKIEEGRFALVVLGEFNHGKSTFVNALLGAPVLPTGITPTTAAINHVVHAAKPTARVVHVDGSAEPIDPKALDAWVTVEGAHAHDSIRYIEVGYPAEILKDRVTLVDTPGVNDLNEQRAEITYEYVPRADAVLFLLDAGQALKESERAFLATRILERTRDRLIFVLGKIDLLDEKELADVTAYVRDHLGKLAPDPQLYAVSAKRHLAGDVEGGRMRPLLDRLARTLTDDRSRVLLDNGAAEGLRAAAYLRQNLGVKKRSLTFSLAELEDKVAKVRAQLAATRDNLTKLTDKIRGEAEAVKAQVRLDLETFAARFTALLPHEIDAVDASDVRKFLPLFIQDKFKEWAELEGERCATLLERLAEEAIAVTNENAREATAALADRLGAGDGRFEVDVDTFKYDVSVYAVGALGTTIFLFVNTLVGGILTLASPILAIILHSKVSAEIKDAAKKQAPAAVEKAAAVMAPHFAKAIDDFTSRLAEFVTSAGDKLYAGIGEILDQAIADRRKAGSSIEPLAAEADAQLARVEDAERAIEKMRADLWA